MNQIIGKAESQTLRKDYFATDDNKLVPPGHPLARRLIGYAGATVLTHQLEGTVLIDNPNADYDDVPIPEVTPEAAAAEALLSQSSPGGGTKQAQTAAQKKLKEDNEKLKAEVATAAEEKKALEDEIAALKKAAKEAPAK